MKKRILSLFLCIVMLISMLPTSALAVNLSEDINSNTVWNDGDVISDPVTLSGGTESEPVTISVNGIVTVNAAITVTGHVRITGGGTLVRGSGKTDIVMISVSNGASLVLDNITLDGNNVESSTYGISVSFGGLLTINEGAVLENYKRNNSGVSSNVLYINGEAIMNGGQIINNTGRNYGNIYLDYNASFTMNGGLICNNTLFLDSFYGGGAFYVRGILTINGGTIRP